jgi:mono/diheme cytochrome c family protein
MTQPVFAIAARAGAERDTRAPLAALALAAATALRAAAAPGHADEIGRAEYVEACAACHGMDGKGEGPLAELMTVEVPDVTTLAAANDGTFPMQEVIMVIDGRTGIRGHGYPMPVWGTRFAAEAGEIGAMGRELAVRGRVLSLALYLQSIQE